jgi:hypothetical protein
MMHIVKSRATHPTLLEGEAMAEKKLLGIISISVSRNLNGAQCLDSKVSKGCTLQLGVETRDCRQHSTGGKLAGGIRR